MFAWELHCEERIEWARGNRQLFCLGEPEGDASGSSPKRGEKKHRRRILSFNKTAFSIPKLGTT